MKRMLITPLHQEIAIGVFGRRYEELDMEQQYHVDTEISGMEELIGEELQSLLNRTK